MGRTPHVKEMSLDNDKDLRKEVYINLANKVSVKIYKGYNRQIRMCQMVSACSIM